MKRALFTIASLVPASVLAQPIGRGGAGPTGDATLDLDPGSRPTVTAPPPPRESSRQPAPQPNIIVVGPDGKVTSSTPPPPENGYYVSGGGGSPGVADQPTEIHTGALPLPITYCDGK